MRTLPEPTADSLNLTTILSALADPSRRALMTVLHQAAEPVDCGTLAQGSRLDLSNATLSHHYRVLRDAGLTSTITHGRNRLVRIRRDEVEARFPGLLTAILDTSQA